MATYEYAEIMFQGTQQSRTIAWHNGFGPDLGNWPKTVNHVDVLNRLGGRGWVVYAVHFPLHLNEQYFLCRASSDRR